MKLINNSNATGMFVIGTAQEIKSIEKSMRRAWREDRSNIWPSHLDKPLYNDDKLYGLMIDWDNDLHPVYYVANEHTVANTLLELV